VLGRGDYFLPSPVAESPMREAAATHPFPFPPNDGMITEEPEEMDAPKPDGMPDGQMPESWIQVAQEPQADEPPPIPEPAPAPAPPAVEEAEAPAPAAVEPEAPAPVPEPEAAPTPEVAPATEEPAPPMPEPQPAAAEPVHEPEAPVPAPEPEALVAAPTYPPAPVSEPASEPAAAEPAPPMPEPVAEAVPSPPMPEPEPFVPTEPKHKANGDANGHANEHIAMPVPDPASLAEVDTPGWAELATAPAVHPAVSEDEAAARIQRAWRRQRSSDTVMYACFSVVFLWYADEARAARPRRGRTRASRRGASSARGAARHRR
jgi:hypothetical protein